MLTTHANISHHTAYVVLLTPNITHAAMIANTTQRNVKTQNGVLDKELEEVLGEFDLLGQRVVLQVDCSTHSPLLYI